VLRLLKPQEPGPGARHFAGYRPHPALGVHIRIRQIVEVLALVACDLGLE